MNKVNEISVEKNARIFLFFDFNNNDKSGLKIIVMHELLYSLHTSIKRLLQLLKGSS